MAATFTQTTKHIYIVPRWAGSAENDWYPWLRKELAAVAVEDGVNYQVQVLDMPAWDLPVIERAVDYLRQALPPEKLNEDVILVGHSVGCLAILHYLAGAANQPGQVAQIGGVLCVAGWFSVDSPWQEVLNWMHAPVDFEAARTLIPTDKLVVLLSDDDPYTSGYKENERLWVERLQSQVSILSGRQHFSAELDCDVRDAVRDLVGGLADPLAVVRALPQEA